MILVDTNVLVALVDARDALRPRAARDLAKAKGRTLRTTRAVLTETLFLLSKEYQRKRLRFLLGALPILEIEGEPAPLEAIPDWIESYAEHSPDLADAELTVLTALRAGSSVWTYDQEFRTTWRRPDGTKIPLFVDPGTRR